MTGRWRHVTQAAAAALRHGWDPIRFLDLEGTDELIGYEILRFAEEQDLERRREYFKGIQNAVQNGVAKAFG